MRERAIVFGERRRSVAFLESDGQTWACFLVTAPGAGGRWRGYFSFRPAHGEADGDEIRTTEIFVEATEEEIHERARGLGKPLLKGLLDSARFTSARNGEENPLRGRFRNLLAENARELSDDWPPEEASPGSEGDLERMKSLYASYRLDQVAHFISLVEPDNFDRAVDAILEGGRVDFRAKDRLQFAMMVVEHIERRLPLPPFEVWMEDFASNAEAYRLYAHTLHREGRLP